MLPCWTSVRHIIVVSLPRSPGSPATSELAAAERSDFGGSFSAEVPAILSEPTAAAASHRARVSATRPGHRGEPPGPQAGLAAASTATGARSAHLSAAPGTAHSDSTRACRPSSRSRTGETARKDAAVRPGPAAPARQASQREGWGARGAGFAHLPDTRTVLSVRRVALREEDRRVLLPSPSQRRPCQGGAGGRTSKALFMNLDPPSTFETTF
jgi:hypothetical protein